mmetsp:Transcript_10543/g.32467  ORF Transcript_10543/g.32467 Transcript_10543/m.32467 type:complete len:211 (+) Transcript_10543:1883-2515(+)
MLGRGQFDARSDGPDRRRREATSSLPHFGRKPLLVVAEGRQRGRRHVLERPRVVRLGVGVVARVSRRGLRLALRFAELAEPAPRVAVLLLGVVERRARVLQRLLGRRRRVREPFDRRGLRAVALRGRPLRVLLALRGEVLDELRLLLLEAADAPALVRLLLLSRFHGLLLRGDLDVRLARRGRAARDVLLQRGQALLEGAHVVLARRRRF